MNVFKLLAGAAAITAIAVAFRDFEAGRWLRPALPAEHEPGTDEAEPVLGYDGMDVDTLVAWLDDAELDDETLLEIAAYERSHRNRARVLEAVSELID